jgi:hypothetical protein
MATRVFPVSRHTDSGVPDGLSDTRPDGSDGIARLTPGMPNSSPNCLLRRRPRQARFP